MGLLSFIYSVLGYNLCATLFIAYLMFDYVLGALATFGARYVMESKTGGAYDFYIRWIRVDYGWTELTLTIGPITFKNPKKFKMTPFLIKIDRISCRVNPRSFLDWLKKKRPVAVLKSNLSLRDSPLRDHGLHDIDGTASRFRDENVFPLLPLE